MSKGPATAALAGLALVIALGAYFLGRVADSSTSTSGSRAPSSPMESDSAARAPRLVEAEPDAEASPSAVRVAAASAPEVVGSTSDGEARPADATVVVRTVSRSTRAPLENVRVRIFRLDVQGVLMEEAVGTKGGITVSPRTGPEGRVEFAVPSGVRCIVNARPDDGQGGFVEEEIPELRAGEIHEVVLELRVGVDLRFVCRVVDMADGRPVVDAIARVVRSELKTTMDTTRGRRAWQNETLTEARTRADGIVAFDLQTWQEAHMRIEAPGFGVALLEPIPGHESEERAFDVPLLRGGRLEARLLDASGAPLREASLRLSIQGFELARDSPNPADWPVDFPDESWIGEVDADGRIVLGDLPPRLPLVVNVLRGNEVLRRDGDPLVVGPGEVLEREWRIGSGARLVGSVLDVQDRPVHGVEIWLVKARSERTRYFDLHQAQDLVGRAVTNDEGEFAIDDVPAGRWWVGPGVSSDLVERLSMERAAPLATPIEVTGAATQTVLVRAHFGLTIRGVVLDARGQRAIDASVHSVMEGSERGPYTNVSSEGAFVLGPLAPGRLTLTAQEWKTDAPSEPTLVEAGSQDVVLRLRPGGRLKGRVVDQKTGEGVLAEISVTPEVPGAGRFGLGMGFSSRENGTFDCGGLEQGHHSVAAETSDGRFGLVRGVTIAGEPSDELTIAVVPGATVELRYEGLFEQIRVQVVAADVRVGWGELLPRGARVELPVPAAVLLLKFQTQDGVRPLQDRTLELQPGERKELVLRDGD